MIKMEKIEGRTDHIADGDKMVGTDINIGGMKCSEMPNSSKGRK